MQGHAIVPDPSHSLVHGIPLDQEPGLGELTLTGFVRDVTTRFADSEAVAQPRPDGSIERWTYAELWKHAATVGRALIAAGVGKGMRVGILMTNRAEFLSAAFGTALAGGIVTPLNTFATAAELHQLIAMSACSILMIEPKVLKKDFVQMLLELEPRVERAAIGNIVSIRYPFLTHVVSLDCDEARGGIEPWSAFLARGARVSDEHLAARAATVAPADPGVLFFSSGSTGRAKGILSAHRGVAIQLWRWGRIFGVRGQERCWTANGMFWSGQFGMAIGCAIGRGGCLVMQSTFKPEEALSLMQAERITMPLAWPHQWAQLAAASNWNDVDLSSLVYVGPDSPLRKHPTVKADWLEPTRIYGNTETFTLSAGYESGTSEAILAQSYGFPMPGMTIKIVDPMTGQITPTGARGEIAVKGATLMLGYIGVPLDTTLDESGFLHTGDAGYVDAQGRLYWEGRLNDIIKTGGANVSPVEIDAVLMQCPGVKLSQTIGVPDELLGELVVSCIVLHAGSQLNEEGIKSFARQQLASYKVPRSVLFLAEKDLSTTGSAKVKTAELRKLASERLKLTHT